MILQKCSLGEMIVLLSKTKHWQHLAFSTQQLASVSKDWQKNQQKHGIVVRWLIVCYFTRASRHGWRRSDQKQHIGTGAERVWASERAGWKHWPQQGTESRRIAERKKHLRCALKLWMWGNKDTCWHRVEVDYKEKIQKTQGQNLNRVRGHVCNIFLVIFY